MTDSHAPAIHVDAMATVSAGHGGTFPEAELICWLRGSFRQAKLLVVQAVRPKDSSYLGSSTRSFEIAELELPQPEAAALTESLNSLGCPHRALRIQDSSSPESIWWAHLCLAVSLNGVRSRLDVGLGPEGLRGEDAEALRAFFRVLLATARCRDELLLDLLTRPQRDF